jgi:hypothetical protein
VVIALRTSRLFAQVPDDDCRFERSGRFEIAAVTMGCRGLKQGIIGMGAAALRYCSVSCYRFGGGTALHGFARLCTARYGYSVIEDDLVGEELDRATGPRSRAPSGVQPAQVRARQDLRRGR